MTIECANARIKTNYSLNDFIKCLKSESEKDFMKKMQRMDGYEDYLKTDYDLSAIGHTFFHFYKNDEDFMSVKHYIKQNDICILFY